LPIKQTLKNHFLTNQIRFGIIKKKLNVKYTKNE